MYPHLPFASILHQQYWLTSTSTRSAGICSEGLCAKPHACAVWTNVGIGVPIASLHSYFLVAAVRYDYLFVAPLWEIFVCCAYAVGKLVGRIVHSTASYYPPILLAKVTGGIFMATVNRIRSAARHIANRRPENAISGPHQAYHDWTTAPAHVTQR